MCACSPSFTCSRCAGTPFDPRYLEDAHDQGRMGGVEVSAARPSLLQVVQPMLDRIEAAARTGGEDSGWIYLFGAKIRDICRENEDLKKQVNSGRAYRESMEGLPEGTLPRV